MKFFALVVFAFGFVSVYGQTSQSCPTEIRINPTPTESPYRFVIAGSGENARVTRHNINVSGELGSVVNELARVKQAWSVCDSQGWPPASEAVLVDGFMQDFNCAAIRNQETYIDALECHANSGIEMKNCPTRITVDAAVVGYTDDYVIVEGQSGKEVAQWSTSYNEPGYSFGLIDDLFDPWEKEMKYCAANDWTGGNSYPDCAMLKRLVPVVDAMRCHLGKVALPNDSTISVPFSSVEQNNQSQPINESLTQPEVLRPDNPGTEECICGPEYIACMVRASDRRGLTYTLSSDEGWDNIATRNVNGPVGKHGWKRGTNQCSGIVQ